MIDLIIRKREGVIFEGQAYAVSSTNEIGDFDVLGDHASLICTIKDSLTIHYTKDKKEEILLDSGVLRAKLNKVEVYIGI